MKKNITLFRKLVISNFYVLLTACLLSFVSVLNAQDVLLGQYEFITGPDQEKATNVVSGLTFSGALEYSNIPTRITAEYENNVVVTSGWLNGSQSINNGRAVQFTISKDVTLDQFKVSKIVILYKRTPEDTNYKINLSVAETVNNGAYRVWNVYEVYYVGPDFDVLTIEKVGESGNDYPVVTDNNPRYFAFAPQAAGPITIDKIEVWGTVVEATNPTITPDINSKTLTASHLYPVTFPVKLTGLFIDETTTLSITGTDNAYFELDKSTLTPEELNGHDVTVNVTYDASILTYDPVAKTNAPHQAVLQIANPVLTTIEIPITASCYVLFEDFSRYDNTTATGTDLSLLPVIPGNNILTLSPNWEGAHLYEFKGASALGCVVLGSSATDSAFIFTPEVDLSQPFELQFKMRSLVNPSDGRIWVYVDNDKLIQTATQTNATMNLKTSNATVGSANSKLKFTGIQLANNQIIIDDITVNYTTAPALNVYLNQQSDFGKVIPLGQKTLNIPLTGYNLTGDVTLSLQNGTNFSVTSGTTIAQATATVGTSIDVQFTAPETVGDYEDMLTLTTSSISRTVKLVGSSDTGTGLANAEDGIIKIHPDGVELIGYHGKNVQVYAITGVKIAEHTHIKATKMIKLAQKGYFVLRIFDENHHITKKIVIQ